MAIKRCLITGINGFAGTYLAEALIEAGHQVTGYTLPGPDGVLSPPMPIDVPIEAGDVRDDHRLAEAIGKTGAQTVFHLAALSHVGESWDRRRETLDVNVLGTNAVLEAAARVDETITVLVVSSGQIYGDVDKSTMPLDEDRRLRPRSPYAASKLCAEVLARQAADAGIVRTVIVRPFNFAGPRQQPSFVCSDFARQVARAEAGLAAPTIRVGNLDARRDFTDVRDMVRGFRCAAEAGRNGRAYNLCSGHGTSIREILDDLRSLARTPIAVEVDEDRFRPVDVPLFVGDGRRAEADLGWTARIALRKTLEDTLAYWRDRCTRETADDV